MTALPPAELSHCAELALVPGSVFEFTSRFVPAESRQRLLALYALRQAIGSIPRSPVDETVKWAKLKWWRDELAAEPGDPSRHPVLRALWLSGARSRLDDERLQGLVGDAVKRMDEAPHADEGALFRSCRDSGSVETGLELALESAPAATGNLDFLAAASGLFGSIAGYAPGHRAEHGRIPLNILARYDVDLVQLEQGRRPAELSRIVAQLARLALDWFGQGKQDAKLAGRHAPAALHLPLRWAMEERRLARIERDPGGFLASGKRFGPADAWFAWRFLRKSKRV